MIINGDRLLMESPIADMIDHKEEAHGVSYGLGEAGYDVRIKQTIIFRPAFWHAFSKDMVSGPVVSCFDDTTHLRSHGFNPKFRPGNFTLASTIERFMMPTNMVGVVHDKSTWARKGLSVFNTVIEPGWEGYLTLELVYHGSEELIIPAGAGIAQVVFHETASAAQYTGKYQDQPDHPVPAIHKL